MRYQVISPDGLPIAHEPFASIAEARDFVARWCKRFERQGYYSAAGRQIPLADLPNCLGIVECE